MSAPFRLFPLITEKEATGKVADIYQHARHELGTVGLPLQALSAADELLGPFWALLRESLLVGTPQERVSKEAVALAVSRNNACDYCTSAHGFLLHAAGETTLATQLLFGEPPSDPDRASLVNWADRTAGNLDNPASIRGPFDYEAGPRFIGTVLAFQFINRMVTALTNDVFPLPMEITSQVSSAWEEQLQRDVTPGEGLNHMGEPVPWMKNAEIQIPTWAQESPVGGAWVRLKAVAEQGGRLLGEKTAQAVSETIQRYVDKPPLRGDWIDQSVQSIDGEPAAIRLALLAGVEPVRISPGAVDNLRDGSNLSDHCATFLMAYGAICATTHIEQTMIGANYSEAFDV